MIDGKTKGLLLNISDHCKIRKDRDTLEIVCFNLLQIGELAKHFDKSVLENYNNVDWVNIKGLRDQIVHGYGNIKPNKIWNIVIDDVPTLFNYCNEILNQKTEQTRLIELSNDCAAFLIERRSGIF